MTQQENKTRAIATKIIVGLLLVYAATQILVVAKFFADTGPTETTYHDGSALRAAQPTLVPLNESVAYGHIIFNVNNISNALDPHVKETWIAQSSVRTPVPLTPPQGISYYVTNVTVTNALNESSPFKYTDLVLIGSDGMPHYASFSTCQGGQMYVSQGSNNSVTYNNTLLDNQRTSTSPAASAASCYIDVVVNQTLTPRSSYTVCILYALPEGVVPTYMRYQVWM